MDNVQYSILYDGARICSSRQSLALASQLISLNQQCSDVLYKFIDRLRSQVGDRFGKSTNINETTWLPKVSKTVTVNERLRLNADGYSTPALAHLSPGSISKLLNQSTDAASHGLSPDV